MVFGVGHLFGTPDFPPFGLLIRHMVHLRNLVIHLESLQGISFCGGEYSGPEYPEYFRNKISGIFRNIPEYPEYFPGFWMVTPGIY